MPVASVDHTFPPRALGTGSLAAALVLAAAVTGALGELIAIGVAGLISSVPAALAMISRAYAIHLLAQYGQAAPNTCQCGGFFGLGVLAVGATLVALPLAGPVSWRPLADGGLVVTAVLFTVGLLFVPGVANSAAARLRQALDALVIGVSMGAVGWLLAPYAGITHPISRIAAVVAVGYTSIAAAALLRGGQHRPVILRCGAGTVFTALGLAMLVVVLTEDRAAPWLAPVAALPMVAGPALTWAGVRRVDPTPGPARRLRLEDAFSGYPMLALPVGAAVFACGLHLVVAGLPDRYAALLGVGAGAALTAREVLAGVDVRRFARQAAQQEARLRALVAGATDVTVVLDDHLVVRWLSPAAAAQLGLTEADVVGKPLTDRVHPDDVDAFADQLRRVVTTGSAAGYDGPALIEARMRDGAGRWRETESTISDLRTAPELGALVVQVRDVGQRRTLERAIRRLASTDRRTGLPNQRELLRAVAARRGAGDHAGVLLVIALYGLVAVSDLEGQAAGDAILVEAARRIRQQVGPDDLPGRLGGSQFAVVTADGPIEAHALAVRLLRALTRPYPLAGRSPVQLQTSIGLTGLAGVSTADEVLRRGSVALRQASQLGRDRIEWYDESLDQQLVRRLDIERHLPGAAGRGELDLAYQPVVQLANQRPVGVVALLRWRHPVLGTVLPGELLPVADRLRVSSEFAEWVLHTACRQVDRWRREGHDVWLAIAVTAVQLTDPDFVAEVASALSVHQTPPERLVVEISNLEITERNRCAPTITESGDARRSPAGNLPEIAAQLSKLRALGVRTALADFGTCPTDLARLRRLPLDLVKLASSSTAGSASELAAAVMHLTQRLGLTVVADGLDTEHQRRLVRGAGCRYGQGDVFAPPAPAERIEAYLESQRARSR